MLMMLAVGYLVCVSGGTSFVNMDQALAIFLMVLKPGWLYWLGCHSEAAVAFAGTDRKLTNEGRPYLGSAIGFRLHVSYR